MFEAFSHVLAIVILVVFGLCTVFLMIDAVIEECFKGRK